MKVKSYRDLIVWQKAMNLVVSIYEDTKPFPKEETFGLSNQLRRAAVSIPSNIAEGQGRNSKKEFVNFLSIAYGSLQEVETQLMIAQRLNYLSESKTEKLLDSCSEVGKLLNGLKRKLRSAP